MTEIQIKNLIKEYEKEYIEFMEIEKLPQYKIDFFEINVEESDAKRIRFSRPSLL